MSRLLRYPFLFVLLLWAPRLNAQNAYAVTDGYYDEQSGEVFGYAYLTIDYEVIYYYKLRIEATLKHGTQTLDLAIEYNEDVYDLAAEVSSTNTRPGATYEISARFRVDARYQDYYGYWWDWWYYTYWPFYEIQAPDYFNFYGPGPDTLVSNHLIWIGKVFSDMSSACGCECSTPLSYAKWYAYATPQGWPNLVRCHTCELASEDNSYNCMAYTLGDPYHWWWLEADTSENQLLSVDELNAFYSKYHYSNIAYYGYSTENIRHVACKDGGNGANCAASSKLGQLILMAHKLSELEGGPIYGDIQGGN